MKITALFMRSLTWNLIEFVSGYPQQTAVYFVLHNTDCIQHHKNLAQQKELFRALLALYNIKLYMITVRVKVHPGLTD